jgi:hypothetical protein
MSTPADELRTAAFQLRNPFHLPGLKAVVDPELASLLADWLDRAAEDAEQIGANFHALAVARLVNGSAGAQR